MTIILFISFICLLLDSTSTAAAVTPPLPPLLFLFDLLSRSMRNFFRLIFFSSSPRLFLLFLWWLEFELSECVEPIMADNSTDGLFVE